MPEVLAIIIAITGLFSTCCGLILTIRSIKKTSPGEEMKNWRKETDGKLDNDHRRLNHLEKDYEKMSEYDRLILRSFKGLLNHLSTGNHTDTMKELIKTIDEYLIDNNR